MPTSRSRRAVRISTSLFGRGPGDIQCPLSSREILHSGKPCHGACRLSETIVRPAARKHHGLSVGGGENLVLKVPEFRCELQICNWLQACADAVNRFDVCGVQSVEFAFLDL